MKVLTAILTAAFVTGTLAPAPDSDEKKEPDQKAASGTGIRAVVAHFEKHGIKLVPDERTWWRVADPKADGYDVVVAFRSFPEGATEQQMKEELERINLGFLLNAPARVAMSYPSVRSKDPKRALPKLKDEPTVEKLLRLFEQYRPPHRSQGH